MKIAIDIRNIGKKRTGSEVVVFELVRHLAKLDRDNTYYLLTDYRADVEIEIIKKRLQLEGAKNFLIKQIGSGGKFSWTVKSVQRFCRKYNVDIYHTEYIIPFFMPRHTKIVTHIHDVSFRVHKDLIKKSDAFFLNTLIPYSVKKSDKIIAISEFTKNEILKYYNPPEEKVAIIYNAVDMQKIDADVYEKYNLPEKYILALGTMQPRKNIPFLIKAFAKLSKEVEDISLVLVGKRSHNFDNKIKQIIEEYSHIKNKIIFTGYVEEEDKYAVYKNAKAFVSPSLYEGFGVPILEAFSARTPAIASDIPPHREVGGKGVLYFDPKNIDQCREVLYDVLVNDKIRGDVLVEATQQQKKFSWEKSAGNLLELYKSINS